jgi:hypothetical protein
MECKTKLYIPNTLNIDLILWHTQLIACAENVKSWVIYFTFQAYTIPHTLNCICDCLFKFHICIFSTAQNGRLCHIKEEVSFELFGALYILKSRIL